GQWTEAQSMWSLLSPMGRGWSRAIYRPGYAEYCLAKFHFYRGDLTQDHLLSAEQLARAGKDRMTIRNLHELRGQWRLERGEWALAAESFGEAITMARAVGQTEPHLETTLAAAKF